MDYVKEFCRQWLAWVEAGASEEHPIFTREHGLCYLYKTWIREVYGKYNYLEEDFHALRERLEKEYGRDEYPFNYGDKAYTYNREAYAKIKHTNLLRIRWARRQVVGF